MDLNQLEVFVTVARERSFSRAAEALHRTQPAVSQAIQRLEEDLGEKLFARSSKDGTPTSAGEVLLDHARHILNLKRAAVDAVHELRDLKAGKITISANEHTVFCLLPVVAKFREQYPDIKVEVQRGVASRIPEQINAREVELGVISFEPDDPTLRAIGVMTDELVLIVSPAHRLSGKREVSIKDLGKESFVAHNAPSPYRHRVLEAFEKDKTSLNIVVELPSLEAIKLLVERDSGVALVPRLSAETEIAAGTLRALRVRELRLERKLNIIYRRNSELSYAAKAFLEIATQVQP